MRGPEDNPQLPTQPQVPRQRRDARALYQIPARLCASAGGLRPGGCPDDVMSDLSAARTATRSGQCRESRARRTHEFARSAGRAARQEPTTPDCQTQRYADIQRTAKLSFNLSKFRLLWQTASGVWLSRLILLTQRHRDAEVYKLRWLGFSRRRLRALRVRFRRMDYASHLTFVNTQPLLPCFISAASPQGERFGGLGAEPPVKKISAPLCLCVRQICRGTVLWLSDAEQWSGTAERSETAEGRENPNHRSS